MFGQRHNSAQALKFQVLFCENFNCVWEERVPSALQQCINNESCNGRKTGPLISIEKKKSLLEIFQSRRIYLAG